MGVFPGSTIAVLCYARKPEFDFHGLATEMSKAIWDRHGGMKLDMPDTDLAICDMADMRIGIARVDMSCTFPGSTTARHYPACMLLSVGPGEIAPAQTMDARYTRARSELVSRLQDVAAADRVLMFERAGSFDAEVHDAVVDDIRAHLDKVLSPHRAPVSDEHAPGAGPAEAAEAAAPGPATAARAPVQERDDRASDTAAAGSGASATETPVGASDPEDIIQGLANRVDAELARLEAARRAFEEAEPTTGRPARSGHGMRVIVPRLFPGLPPSTVGLFRMPGQARSGGGAYPDYDHMPANVDDRPLLHRAAVNALNVTVMTIALPVGAALLTMSVLGREDMLFSSRVTAVTGVGVGLYNTGAVNGLLSLFS